MKFSAAILSLALLPSLAFAHSMKPGFETELATLPTFVKTYQLTNDYPHPAVFEVQVFEKDWKPAEGWQAKRASYKLYPGSIAQVKIKFEVPETRKLLVCSILTEIGVHGKKASMISRVCSRLIIKPINKVKAVELPSEELNPNNADKRILGFTY